MGYTEEYFREMARRNRQKNKELSVKYRSEADPFETFTQFKKRNKVRG